MRHEGTRWCVVVLGSLVGCGFHIDASAPNDGPTEGPIDMPPDENIATDRRAAVIVVNRSTTGNNVFALPFDAQSGFGTACPDTPASPSQMLVAHPTLAYVYSVASSLDGISVACGPMMKATLAAIGDPRTVQRIVVEPSVGVGFATIDGPASVGAYRFAVDSAGNPTSVSGTDAPDFAGALAVDWSTKQLFVGGANFIWVYQLTSTFTVTPNSQVGLVACATPIDLVISGGGVFSFCGDTGYVIRYAESALTGGASAGVLGAVDAVRSLSPTRVIAARVSPPDLAIVDLGTTLTVTPGPPLANRVRAMSTSADGQFVVTSQQTTATEALVTVWSVTGTSLTMLDSQIVSGAVTSVAVTPAP